MNPSITPSESIPAKTAELAVGHRQLAALGFVLFLLLACVATVAYLAGRVSNPRQETVVEAKAVRPAPASSLLAAPPVAAKTSSAVEQLIVVEPASPSPPAATQPGPPPASSKAPEIKPLSQELLAGSTFWQVAATDRGMAEVTLELLTRKGLPTLLGDGPSPGIFRVLVGPLKNAEETSRFKAALDEGGFHPFIKKY